MEMVQTFGTGYMWKITAQQFLEVLNRGRVGETYCIGGNSEKNKFGSGGYDLRCA